MSMCSHFHDITAYDQDTDITVAHGEANVWKMLCLDIGHFVIWTYEKVTYSRRSIISYEYSARIIKSIELLKTA